MRATPDQLLDAVYDAPAVPDGWQRFLEMLSDSIRGTATVLHVEEVAPRRARVSANVRLDDSATSQYEQYYASKNVWMLQAAPRLRPGLVIPGQAVCPEAQLERSEYYNDYLQHLDLFHVVSAFGDAGNGALALLSAFRPRRASAFDAAEVAVLESLLPHLERALRLDARIAEIARTHDAALGALEALPEGLVLADATGRVLVANREARRIVALNDGLRIDRGELACATPGATRALRLAIAAATRHTASIAPAPDILVERPSGRRALVVTVAPVGTQRSSTLGLVTHAVALTVHDPERAPEGEVQRVARRFALTRREADVASRVAMGQPRRRSPRRCRSRPRPCAGT